ncbi:arginine--tRNA ligase [Actinokineospora sp. UTMC 2448]|uniref:arginine--tRNA ligase n=1 Tax=Actinokineospora sp. UTMC 2448 TaxID=2268449 RepID=UPI002164460D|nr:arginine--tRNA ligase [Actinokineospora sp. UTMC 2448]UVS76900.1 Arginine--tRNA ligase [Actinokineospora sp. UTMC 2448]
MSGDITVLLGQRVADALAPLGVEITPDEALIRPSTRPGADYQCNVAMSLGKKLGRPPRELAQAIVDGMAAPEVEAPEVAGPGFINLALRTDWLAARLSSLDDRVGVVPAAEPRRFALDYSSPNVAKEMHVGHLRSTIIGESLLRLLRFAGHEVVPHNHLGDWGTPFGMLIEHLSELGWSGDHTIGDLNGFYQEARKKFDADPDFADRARLRVVALQSGDEPTLALWRDLVEESTRHFAKVYELLDISLTPSDIYGESFYNPYLAEVITEMEAQGITAVSDGAVCVFPPGFANRDGDPLPLILRKRDGGYGYPVTDLATVRYWIRDRGMTDLLYVVGTPQAQHFQMVFAASRMAGYLGPGNTAVHIGFGTILGEDGKTIRTRAGGTLKLVDLLDEAVQHAAALVKERSSLDADEQAEVARAVGIGAVKYADLSGDREKDYTFTWERMLATEGNTSVYLQYANARIHSILRKAGESAPGEIVITEPAERALALKLAQFPTAIAAAVEGYAPHKLCLYLFETATAFTSFYDSCPILAATTPEPVRRSRLALAVLTSTVLTRGLSLLGIEAPTRM